MTLGKQALVAGLVSTQAKHLRRFLLTRVRNAADIPDLMQEIFLRLLRVPVHEAIRSPEAYLFTIARHVAQQHSLRSQATPTSAELQHLLTEFSAADAMDPALEVWVQQSLEDLDRALAHLPPRVRATFLLHRRDGLTLEDIGRQFGVSRPQAKKYLARAVAHLRKQLDE